MKIESRTLLNKYLLDGNVMQLATVSKGKPWICTVFYVTDDKMNIYWLSLPSRRHSRDIAEQPQVAVTVPIKFDLPVIGVQAEGTAETVDNHSIIKTVMKKYTEKYGSGKLFYDNFIAGKNQHQMYQFKPKKYVIFDEVNFPEDGSREIDFSKY